MSMSRSLARLARSPTRAKALTASALMAAGYPAAAEDPETFARKLSTVDRCMSILAGSMSKLPNYIFDSGTRERPTAPGCSMCLTSGPNEANDTQHPQRGAGEQPQ